MKKDETQSSDCDNLSADFYNQFEKNAVEIWKEKGASLHYASNFQIKAYEFEAEFF